MSENRDPRSSGIIETRTTSFTAKGRTWVYPLPHLLAMQLDCTGKNDPEGDNLIKLYFSTETVVIRGKFLVKLWEELVMNPAMHIGTSEPATVAYGTPQVKHIEIPPDSDSGPESPRPAA